MATTKSAVPRPPSERPPERQHKRPGVRYVRRESLPPIESSKARGASKSAKDSTKPRSYRIKESEQAAAGRPRTAKRPSKSAALPEVQRVKRVNERKGLQSSKLLSRRSAEERGVHSGPERESIPHQRRTTRSYNKKVPGEESRVSTKRQSSEVESKRHKAKNHPKETPRRYFNLDAAPLDDSSMASSPSSSMLSDDDSHFTALSYESMEKERRMYADHKAEVEKLLEEERAFQKEYPALLEQLKRRRDNVKAAEEASAKLESAYKKEVDFFTTQLEEVYKNTSVLVTTLQSVEKEKKKAEERKREQENEKMMEMRKQMLKRILDEHLTHAHKDDEDIDSVASRDAETNSTSTQTNEVDKSAVPAPPPLPTKPHFIPPSDYPAIKSTSTQTNEVETTLQPVVLAPSPLATKPHFATPSHNRTASNASTQTNKVETSFQPCPPPLSAQPSFTRPSRYLRSKHTKESSQKDGSPVLADGGAKKIESPLQSQSTFHSQVSPTERDCSSVTVLDSTCVPNTMTGSTADVVTHAQSNPKATSSHEMSAPGTNVVTKNELEKKLLEKLAQFDRLLQKEAAHLGVNNTQRLNKVQSLVSAIEEEMDTTASISSKLVKERQEEASTSEALICGSDTNTPPQCSNSRKLSSVAQHNSSSDKVGVSDERTNQNAPLDIQHMSSSAVDEHVVELPAVTSPSSLHCGSEEKTNVPSSAPTGDVSPSASLIKQHTTAEVSAENNESDDASNMQNESQSEDEEYITILPSVTSPYFLHCGPAEDIDLSHSNKSTESALVSVQDLASAMSSAIISEVLSDRSKRKWRAALGTTASNTITSTATAGHEMKPFSSSPLASDNSPSSSLVQSKYETCDLDSMAGSIPTTTEVSTENTDQSYPVDKHNEATSADEECIIELPAVTSPCSLHCGTAENIDASQSNKSTDGGASDVHELATAMSSVIVSEVLSNQSRKESGLAEDRSDNDTNSSSAVPGNKSTASPTILGTVSNPSSLRSMDRNAQSDVTLSSPLAEQDLAISGSPIDHAVSDSVSENDTKALSKASIKTQSRDSSVTIFQAASGKEMNEAMPSEEVVTSGPSNEAQLENSLSVCSSKKSDMNDTSSAEESGDIDASGTEEGAVNSLKYQDSKVPYPLANVTSSNINAAESSGSTASTMTVLFSAESNISRVTVVLTAPSNECLPNSSDLLSCGDAEVTADGQNDSSMESTFERVTTSVTTADASIEALAKDITCGDDTQACTGTDVGMDGTDEEHAVQVNTSAADTDDTGILTGGERNTTPTVPTATGMDSSSFGSNGKRTGDKTPISSTKYTEESDTFLDSGSTGDYAAQTVTSAIADEKYDAEEISLTPDVASAVNAEEQNVSSDTNEVINTSNTVHTDAGTCQEKSAASGTSATASVEASDCISQSNHRQQTLDCNGSSGDINSTSVGYIKESSTSLSKGKLKSSSTHHSSTTASWTNATSSAIEETSGTAASVSSIKKAPKSASSLQANSKLLAADSKEKSVEAKTKSRTSTARNVSGTGSKMSTQSSRQHCHAGVRKTKSDPSGSKLPSLVLKEFKGKSLASLRTSDIQEAAKPSKKRSRAAELGLTRPKSKPNTIPVHHQRSSSVVLPKLTNSNEELETKARTTAVIKNSKETISSRESAKSVTQSQSVRSHSRSSHEKKKEDISLPPLCSKTQHQTTSKANCTTETQRSEDKVIHSPSTRSRGSTEKCVSHGSVKRGVKTSSSKNLKDEAVPTRSNARIPTSTRSFRKYCKAVQEANSCPGNSALPSDILKESKCSKSLASFRTSDMEKAAYPKEKRSRAAELGLTRAKSKPNMIPKSNRSSDSCRFKEMVSLKRCSKESCCECNEKSETRAGASAVKKISEKTTAGNESAKKVVHSCSDRAHCKPSQSMKRRSKSFPEEKMH